MVWVLILTSFRVVASGLLFGLNKNQVLICVPETCFLFSRLGNKEAGVRAVYESWLAFSSCGDWAAFFEL